MLLGLPGLWNWHFKCPAALRNVLYEMFLINKEQKRNGECYQVDFSLGGGELQ